VRGGTPPSSEVSEPERPIEVPSAGSLPPVSFEEITPAGKAITTAPARRMFVVLQLGLFRSHDVSIPLKTRIGNRGGGKKFFYIGGVFPPGVVAARGAGGVAVCGLYCVGDASVGESCWLWYLTIIVRLLTYLVKRVTHRLSVVAWLPPASAKRIRDKYLLGGCQLGTKTILF